MHRFPFAFLNRAAKFVAVATANRRKKLRFRHWPIMRVLLS